MTKYNARRVTIDGHTFASDKEATRYGELKLLQMAGEISGLECHPTFTLQEGFTDAWGRHHRGITYEADFQYVENGVTIVEDVKAKWRNKRGRKGGTDTEMFRVKFKIAQRMFPHLKFEVVE